MTSPQPKYWGGCVSPASPARLAPVMLHSNSIDVPQRVIFKLCMTVYKCLHSLSPKYFAELCVPVVDVAGRRQLRSASRGLFEFSTLNVSNYGRRAFCFAGPYVWNSLSEHIRQSTSIAVFKRSLKTFLLQQISHIAH